MTWKTYRVYHSSTGSSELWLAGPLGPMNTACALADVHWPCGIPTEQVRKVLCSNSQVSDREVSKLFMYLRAIAAIRFEIWGEVRGEARGAYYNVDLSLYAVLVHDTLLREAAGRLGDDLNIGSGEALKISVVDMSAQHLHAERFLLYPDPGVILRHPSANPGVM